MFRLFTIAVALVLAIPSHAIEDPTRPPSAKRVPAAVKAGIKPKLTAILVGPERRVATINNRIMVEGQRAGGITLERIDADAVVVSTHSGRMTLSLASKKVIKEAK